MKNAFPESPSFNEVTLELDCPVSSLIKKARDANLHDRRGRFGEDLAEEQIAIFSNSPFATFRTMEALDSLIRFFHMEFPRLRIPCEANPPRPSNAKLFREEKANLPSFSFDELAHYYEKLADLSVSPDDGCYPLGSCTMKYNPMLNDWAAGLPGFSQVHPQAPEEDSQGPLSVLYETQEWFKKITGLAAVTTQPVAGAQGELVGLKLFQAYHRKRGEEQRNIVLIPKSAHGTNFATAAMAGYPDGIVYLSASDEGTIDMDDFAEKINSYGDRLCGVMITNPNTSGIFENRFHEIAEAVHEAGGLVYMDGANMNAIAGIIDLGAIGVDAVHNNLHKTWTIPHGGGGPGDAIVAVSERLVDFLPGKQYTKTTTGSSARENPSSASDPFTGIGATSGTK